MAKITIIEGNSNDKDQVRAYMASGLPGISPTVETSKTGDTATITITDVNGEHEVELEDGFSPTITPSKTGGVTTLTIVDDEGTKTATINDGIDLTGGVPTNGVIGFDGNAEDIPNGYEVAPFIEAPIGSISLFAGSTAPSGYLICDGSAVSRTTYSGLFDVINTTYGTGDGSTTFNLPNLKGKVPVGLDSNDTSFDSLGETGGEKNHTLITDEIPAHYHNAGEGKEFIKNTGETFGYGTGASTSIAVSTKDALTGSTGGGQAHNNLQPYIVMNYIIKY